MTYDENNTRFKGVIDIESNSTAPVLTDNAGNITASYFKFDRGGSVAIQLSSDDISASVDWALEISLDGINWAAALDNNDTAITGTLVVDTPFVSPYRAQSDVYVRVNFTVTTETGNVSYIFKNNRDWA